MPFSTLFNPRLSLIDEAQLSRSEEQTLSVLLGDTTPFVPQEPAPTRPNQLPSFLRSLLPLLLPFAFTAAAHAQGTIDFSGANTLMGSFKTFAIYAGAVIAFGSLIFAGLKMMGGRFQEAIPGLFGALFGAAVLGWGAGWISSLTGQSVQ